MIVQNRLRQIWLSLVNLDLRCPRMKERRKRNLEAWKNRVKKVLNPFKDMPPGPPGSIEYIRWQAAKQWEEDEDER